MAVKQSDFTITLPTKLKKKYAAKIQKKNKLKSKCCIKYAKKKGKFCKSCPTLYMLIRES